MIKKKIIDPYRVRHINGGFSFIPHRFITDGFLSSLNQKALLLYLFLILVSDRHGLSFYSYDAVCTLLQINLEEYMEARDDLIKKDLIAFDSTIYQVLDLPSEPIKEKLPPIHKQQRHPSHIKKLIQQSLWGAQNAG